MIESLQISNFRLFENFEINELKPVNLITGKNNTGKTVLLEALRLLASPDEESVYINLMVSRGHYDSAQIDSWSTFFNRNIAAKNPHTSFKINGLQLIRKVKEGYPKNEFQVLLDGNEIQFLVQNSLHIAKDVKPQDKAVYVPFGGALAFPLQNLWDKIVLTELEDNVMDILRETILPDLVRLDVKEERTLVRLKSETNPIPLKSLGDGAQRMLQLAIALVNARNNILLIDEIEAGLHHSVLETLWDKIFYYSQKWNIQVFATTHSHDVLKTYVYNLEKASNKDKGTYFRLQRARKTGNIEAIKYALEDLEISLESNLEPR